MIFIYINYFIDCKNVSKTLYFFMTDVKSSNKLSVSKIEGEGKKKKRKEN